MKGITMPKYLISASYTSDGVKGLMADGGSARIAEATSLISAAGGKLESMYFAFGSDDLVGIVEVPDSVTALAVVGVVSSSGRVSARLTPLITPEEMDAAATKSKSLTYRAPGA